MEHEVVFVLGAPGAGKGTQCKLISDKFDFVHISAGELLREERQRPGSEFADEIEKTTRKGQLVPVELICSLMSKAMQKSGKTRFLIDGFPRKMDNLDGWISVMSKKTKLLFVLLFDCSREICIERCLERGTPGDRRSDDTKERVAMRFDSYYNDTMPVIEHFDEKNLLRRINAETSPEAVFESVKDVFIEGGLQFK